MIKFIYIGDQLVDGGKQFAFEIYHQIPSPFFSNGRYIFNSWDEFVRIYNENKCNKLFDMWYIDNHLSDFKSLMPSELLQKDASDNYKSMSHHDENKVLPSSKILNHALKLSIEDNPYTSYAGIFKEAIADKFILDAILNYLDEIAVLYNE